MIQDESERKRERENVSSSGNRKNCHTKRKKFSHRTRRSNKRERERDTSTSRETNWSRIFESSPTGKEKMTLTKTRRTCASIATSKKKRVEMKKTPHLIVWVSFTKVWLMRRREITDIFCRSRDALFICDVILEKKQLLHKEGYVIQKDTISHWISFSFLDSWSALFLLWSPLLPYSFLIRSTAKIYQSSL
jgi:hypothetical protein